MSDLVKHVETPQQALQRILTAGRKQLEIAVGEAMNPDRMIRLAVTALHQTPALQNCSMVSIANSVMLAAQLRLEINTSLGHAWLIPYKSVCTFQPGYRGLIELAHRSAEVHDVNAHVVYGKDHFEIEYGEQPRCVHKPSLFDRGDWIGAYAVIRYRQGPPGSLWMPRLDIEAIRDQSSQSYKSEKYADQSPWVRFPDEMRRKTVTKRLLKYVRLSVYDLSRAIGLDDQAEAATSEGAKEPSKDPRRIPQESILDTELLDMAEEATFELQGSSERQQETAEEKISAAHPELSREEVSFNAMSQTSRKKLWAQFQHQLGEEKYRDIVNTNRGALNFQTYQELQAALKTNSEALS